MKTGRSRVILVGEVRDGTGYSRVYDNLRRTLASFCDCTSVPIIFSGPTEPRRTSAIVASTPENESKQLLALLNREQPDALIVNHDIGIAHRLSRAIEHAPRGTVTFLFCPLDYASLDPAVTQAMGRFNWIVCYTWHQASVVRRALDRFASASPTKVTWVHVPPPQSIVEASRSFTSPTPNDIRQVIGASSDIMILNANRNDIRKRIDLSIEVIDRTLALGARGLKLVLHCGGLERSGWNLSRSIPSRLREYIILTSALEQVHPKWDESHLSALYASCNVGLNTSAGEGWGLTAFEHALFGAAQLLPGNPNLLRLWGRNALFSRVSRPRATSHPYVLEWVPVAADYAEHLAALADDRTMLQEYSLRARNHVLSSHFSETRSQYRWKRLLDGSLAEAG